MIAGRLNEIVKIWRSTEVINEYGERSEEWAQTYSTRAKVDYNSGTRTTENNEIVFDYTKQFNVRSYVPVVETDRLQWNGKMYRIMSIEPRREYNDKVITAELINE